MAQTREQRQERLPYLLTDSHHHAFGLQALKPPQYMIGDPDNIEFPWPDKRHKFFDCLLNDDSTVQLREGLLYTRDSDSWTYVPVYAARSMMFINEVTRGDGAEERIGKKVHLHSLHLRLHVATGLSNDGTISKCTTLLLYSLGTSGNAINQPGWLNILVAQEPDALYNEKAESIYKVLRRWDHFVAIGANSDRPFADVHAVIDEIIPLEGMITEWLGSNSNGDGRDIVKGQLILATVGDNTEASIDVPYLDGVTRLVFRD